MAHDFNYLMFHQHLFAELNELQSTKLDLRFISPGNDLVSMDMTHTMGLSYNHTFQLVTAC